MRAKIKEIFLLVATVYALQNTYEACVDTDKLAAVNEALVSQIRMQQLAMEENIRYQGNSGIKRIRQFRSGTKPYHVASFSSYKMLAIHTHADHKQTVGLGELSAVLNGVQFRTRHNDYPLMRSSSTSREYGAVEPMPMPDVPPAVLAKTTIKEQVAEMKEWFKAWRDNNHRTGRDYRKYFWPILCYLEGYWTYQDKNKLEEPFTSDRHLVEARTWDELFQKVEFTSYTGHKNERENYAFLPSKIMGLTNESIPIIAQWNYRILCHKINGNLLKDRLRVVDDFHLRAQYGWTIETLKGANAARFEINSVNSNKFADGHYTYGLLDQIMERVPGLNNYRGQYMLDKTFNVYAKNYKRNRPLVATFYHRFYKVDHKGAMGTQVRHRGYNDKHIFFAKNKQKHIVPVSVQDKCVGRGKRGLVCAYKSEERWSYAIPLELIYLTPLSTWNPHNIKYRGDASSAEGKKVSANGRNGGKTKATAYDGINSKSFYITPAEMFNSDEVNSDPADTVKHGSIGVLNNKGEVVQVTASGIRVFFPKIPGVGIMRQRYPIAPIADDGSTVWKELSAIKEYLFYPSKFPKIKNETAVLNKMKPGANPNLPGSGAYQMEYAEANRNLKVPQHTHTIRLSSLDLNILLKKYKRITVTTSNNAGHSHVLRIGVRFKKKGSRQRELYYVTCDNKKLCGDGHGIALIKSDYE